MPIRKRDTVGMNKVLIWGAGSFYDKYLSKWIWLEKIEILGFVANEIANTVKQIDGKPLIDLEEIQKVEFDYIIVASRFFAEIKKQALACGIDEDKIINGKVMTHPCFNWERYIEIKNSGVSLITEACYGGYIYNQLGLKFTSPFINTRIQQNDYLRLLKNLDYYLEQKIKLREEIDFPISSDNVSFGYYNMITWGKSGYFIFDLGDIPLHAIHAMDVQSYLDEWERRRARINKNKLFVMMIIDNDVDAERFSQLSFENKVGFYYRETGIADIVCLKEWNDYKIRLKWGHDFLSYVHHMIYDEKYLRCIDIFRLLTGEKDFIRLI